jgi:hypothetical protein
MCQIIGEAEKEALQQQAQNCPWISMQRLLVDGGYIPEEMLNSLELGQSLIEKGLIKETQFCVGMFDEVTINMTMKDSLIVRGWLPADWKADNP